MDRPQLPLNALRAFEAAARHLNITRAAMELCVGQAAVSHQIKALETRLGAPLFRRLPRGLALTDEGAALMPLVREAFDRIGATLDQFMDGRLRQVLTVGVVGTFALGWLLPRLGEFSAAFPGIDLRVRTNTNRVDLAGEGLDCAIRFGDGAWHGMAATPLLAAPLAPLCASALAAGLVRPADLATLPLLRSYRAEEWERWFAAAGTSAPPLRGPVFDSSPLMASAAAAGLGVALLPVAMFTADLAAERLVQPFPQAIDAGRYWFTRLNSRPESPAMAAFRGWLEAQAGQTDG